MNIWIMFGIGFITGVITLFLVTAYFVLREDYISD